MPWQISSLSQDIALCPAVRQASPVPFRSTAEPTWPQLPPQGIGLEHTISATLSRAGVGGGKGDWVKTEPTWTNISPKLPSAQPVSGKQSRYGEITVELRNACGKAGLGNSRPASRGRDNPSVLLYQGVELGVGSRRRPLHSDLSLSPLRVHG